MPLHFIYPVYSALLMLLVLAVVPREQIKKLSLFAIIFGAGADLVVIVVITILGVGEYINIGPFGFMGIPFFPLLAWTAFFILYFYFFPEKIPWSYIYVLLAAGYSTMFSNVLENLGIFRWNYGNLVVPYLIYLGWFSLASWYYLKDTREEKVHEKQSTNNQSTTSIRILRNPAWKLNLNVRKKIK
ncbi:hypothetical protein SPSYN_02881 [Sporotomaculum syntrophicum]|uniref:Uncharacterized protein n=1 Tax=Sporotomaculum syntrophicum TaxID=182264 RepID=A0A9D3AXQ6_9FIRM|nr:hypothetical protein [Sporotomaculum syntrophicum]KAF1083969.1 hypothetical protein SPSYN_02881 [Sporotomaculum syntrophicum]